jgi:hydrogenase nickel incorporation protein HypA/HybF
MHEMAIVEDIVATVSRACAGQRVRRVVLEIGALAAVVPDAIAGCFEVASTLEPGGPLDGAKLDIVVVAGRGRCRSCGIEIELSDPLGTCPCGLGLEWTAGTKLTIRELEVD